MTQRPDESDWVINNNFVIPAKAGIQVFQGILDPSFRWDDGNGNKK